MQRRTQTPSNPTGLRNFRGMGLMEERGRDKERSYNCVCASGFDFFELPKCPPKESKT